MKSNALILDNGDGHAAGQAAAVGETPTAPRESDEHSAIVTLVNSTPRVLGFCFVNSETPLGPLILTPLSVCAGDDNGGHDEQEENIPNMWLQENGCQYARTLASKWPSSQQVVPSNPCRFFSSHSGSSTELD